MNEQPNRTFVCSVLFLDIVEYSKCSVAEQMTLKQRLNALLGQVLLNVAANDRIVLDTGDGAAISFLGTPEDALFAAMSLRDAVAAESPSKAPVLAIRIGINLGPVRLIKDLNGQLNIIGDGINVAQRVMSFVEPGQILVSRSYYEVVSRLSPEFSQLFRYEGARTDKHVRDHEVYQVGPTSNDLRISSSAASVANVAYSVRAEVGMIPRVKRWIKRFDARLLVLLPVGIAIVLAAAVVIRMQRHEATSPPPVAVQEPTRAAPATQPVPGVQPMPAHKPAPQPKPKEAVPAEQAAPVARALEAPVAASAPKASATLRLTIIPWGEVFVDGKSHGVSPPLKQVSLSPGKHLIVVTNTSLPPHEEPIELKPGEQFTIRHRFN
ncbi:MAG: hypothetical protein HY661_12840 [Betaproteobacteria bacterium]|nr:hypothetical protein [Betaproteobacteria bacterium]